MEKVTGRTLIFAHELSDIFAGLVFNLEKMRVVLPDGQLLNKARFGGYVFVLDTDNEKTTRSAWRAFTANQAFRPTIVFK